MNRTEHINWTKDRALQELEYGGVTAAIASFQSDLGKHDETFNYPAKELAMGLFMAGYLGTKEQVKKFIEGIN